MCVALPDCRFPVAPYSYSVTEKTGLSLLSTEMQQKNDSSNGFLLPSGFLFGTATASLQIEGGDTNNSWYRWCKQGHVHDGTDCFVADDHWNRVEEDVSLIAALGNNAYRMSLEWSRIEPAEGRFSEEAIAHYRNELRLLVNNGVKPLVTLHHFSNPLWFGDSGGWLDSRAVGRFERYAERVVRAFGDLVTDWITINEPNVFLIMGYAFGVWPPGEKSVAKVLRGARVMAEAHARGYETIHRVQREAWQKQPRVGVAHHLRIYDPVADKPRHRFAARLYERVTQEMFVRAMTDGTSVWPLGRVDLSATRSEHGFLSDFIGINYYTRDMIRFALSPGSLFGKQELAPGAETNELGWELYPEGLSRLIHRYWERYRLPILITENGTCDAQDAIRPRYLVDHLEVVARATEAGADVEGYFHWSLMDNFEWVEGLSARFGLYEVDYETQERRLRDSGKLYAEIARSGGASPELLSAYGL